MSSLIHRRLLYDAFARYAIAVGGIAVIAAVVLIFFYLLYVVLPIFYPASLDETARYPLRIDGTRVLHMEMEELGEAAARVRSDGRVDFLTLSTGEVSGSVDLKIPPGVTVTSFGAGLPASRNMALGLSDGTAIVLKIRFDITYPDDQRTVTPVVEYPLGERRLALDASRRPLTRIAPILGEESAGIAVVIDGTLLKFQEYAVTESLVGDGKTVEDAYRIEKELAEPVRGVFLSPDMRSIYAVHKGSISYYDLTDRDGLHLREKIQVVAPGEEVTQAAFPLEGISLLVGDSAGRIAQWFLVRDDNNNYSLAEVREFQGMGAPVTAILAEHRRKSFIVGDADGGVGL